MSILSCPVTVVHAAPELGTIVAVGNVCFLMRLAGAEDEAPFMAELFRLPPGHLIVQMCAVNPGCVACSAGNTVFLCSQERSRAGERPLAWTVEQLFAAPSRVCALRVVPEDDDTSENVSLLCVTCTNIASLLSVRPEAATGTSPGRLSGVVKQTVAAPREAGLSFAAAVTSQLVLCGNYSGAVLAWSWLRASDRLEAAVAGQHKPGSVIYSLVALLGDGPDQSTIVATASDDRTVCLSILRAGEAQGSVLWRSNAAGARIWAVALSAPASGSLLLASGGEDGCVTVFGISVAAGEDTGCGMMLQQQDGCHRGAGVSSLAWTDRGTLVSGGAAGRVLEHHWKSPGKQWSSNLSVKIRCLVPLFVDGGRRALVAVCSDAPSCLMLLEPRDGADATPIFSVPICFGEVAGGRPQLVTSLACISTTSQSVEEVILSAVGSNRGTVAALLVDVTLCKFLKSAVVTLGAAASVLCVDCLARSGDDCSYVAAGVTADGLLHVLRWTSGLALLSHRSVPCWRGPAGSVVGLHLGPDMSVSVAAGAKGGLAHFFSVNDDGAVAQDGQVNVGVDRAVQSLQPNADGGWRVMISDGRWIDGSGSACGVQAKGLPQHLAWPVSSVLLASKRFIVTVSNCTASIAEASLEGPHAVWAQVGQVLNMRAPHLFGAVTGAGRRLAVAYSPDGASVCAHVGPPSTRVVRGGLSGKDLNAAVALLRGRVAVAGEDTSVYVVGSPDGEVAELRGGHSSNVLTLATAAGADCEFLLSCGGRSGIALWRRELRSDRWTLAAASEAGMELDTQAIPRVLCSLLSLSEDGTTLTSLFGLSDGTAARGIWQISTLGPKSVAHREVFLSLGSPLFCLAILPGGQYAVGCGDGRLHVLEERIIACSATAAQCSLNSISAASSIGNLGNEAKTTRIVCGTDGGEIVVMDFSSSSWSLVLAARVQVASTACRCIIFPHAAFPTTLVFVCDATLHTLELLCDGGAPCRLALTGSRHLCVRGVAHGCCRRTECGSFCHMIVVGSGVEEVALSVACPRGKASLFV
jgi:hypothetical protein